MAKKTKTKKAATKAAPKHKETAEDRIRNRVNKEAKRLKLDDAQQKSIDDALKEALEDEE
ncbi:hypothetical protein LCGC14_2899610 [marine sediment metagenome]|uniref:Uncharacterized protein n=1 Tax=marine sediment metagenome TaxID=412755 RepID=A0A0F8YGR8_9ZZZZ